MKQRNKSKETIAEDDFYFEGKIKHIKSDNKKKIRKMKKRYL